MTWLEIVVFAAAVIVGTLVMGYAIDKFFGDETDEEDRDI
jgi:hypothetical protein